MSISLRQNDAERLDDLTQATGMTKNEVIRTALAIHAFVQRTIDDGDSLVVEDAKGNFRNVEFVT